MRRVELSYPSISSRIDFSGEVRFICWRNGCGSINGEDDEDCADDEDGADDEDDEDGADDEDDEDNADDSNTEDGLEDGEDGINRDADDGNDTDEEVDDGNDTDEVVDEVDNRSSDGSKANRLHTIVTTMEKYR